jgi:hypothetical protein
VLAVGVALLFIEALNPLKSGVEEGAAHFNPVDCALSATMLQLGKGIILASAQSCANVLDKRIIPILNCELWN